MVPDEIREFIRYNDVYKNLCDDLPDNLDLHETTVAAFTSCGTKTGAAFLSRNFSRVFGYSRNLFIEGDLQFLVKHMHPDDLPAFISFAEISTLNARPWREVKEKAVHECCSRIRHCSGKWIWINQKVVVLSVTADRHIDVALLLFDDCTAAKQAQLDQHLSAIEKSRKNSKLLQVLAPVSNHQTKRERLLVALEDNSPLTHREKEVMQLVSEGFSSKEIAAKLFISIHTVESHRKHILHKLSVKNAVQMVHQSVVSSFNRQA
jgi:DNA-binding CsgD family transcriptional regulator